MLLLARLDDRAFSWRAICLLFALFWDLMLIPVFFVLVGWGRASPRRAWRYLIYNVAGGLALLLATAAYGIIDGTTDVIGVASAACSSPAPSRLGFSPVSLSRSW